ncbi:MAG: amidophosphoribosyltransferase, partial [Methanobacteriota archaeon]
MARDPGTSEYSDLRPKEKCGIIGCTGTSPVTSDLYYGLRILQHRGQESAGLAVFDGGLKAKRGMGLVHEVFTKEDLLGLRGNSGIGH